MPSRNSAIAAAALIALAACGSDSNSSESLPGADSSVSSVDADQIAGDVELAVTADAPFPEARCMANEAAGTITFLTGFDFAAASSIVDVIAADATGYYDELCLDVEVVAGFSSSNYPLVASGTAQFASGGSFSEVVAFANANDVNLIATTVEGRSAIDTLIVKSGTATELSELAGTTIGVKGKLPPSVDVMLRGAGLSEGDQFDTVLLDGFNPIAHLALDIDGLPGWKSNEVGALERAGVGVQLFDPLDFGVPGSFGVIFTTAEFVEEHPTAAQDFTRATLRGLADAVADPEATSAIAIERITENGNPNFLSPEGEAFRWETEADLILTGNPEGAGLAVPDPVALQAEIDAYDEVMLFGTGETPSAVDYLSGSVTSELYQDTTLIWPS